MPIIGPDSTIGPLADHAAPLLRIDRRITEVGADADAGSYAAALLAMGADGAQAQAEVDATASLLGGKHSLMYASVVSDSAARHAANHAAA